MFQSTELDNHLKTSNTIQIESAVYVEWNLNDMENVERLGNYRYRPSYPESKYYLIPANYDPADRGQYYTGATNCDIAIDTGFDQNDKPTIVVSRQDNINNLYSLEDCVKRYRPRSGINKVLYLGTPGASAGVNQYLDDANPESARRPRYYMASKYDIFKYWTSYRTEFGVPTPRPDMQISKEIRQVERGVSFPGANNEFYIEDAAPFVVYKDIIPTNKIVVKMQTNVGDIDLGNMRYGNTVIPDPLYGYENSTTPVIWRIEGLDSDDSWVSLYEFDQNSLDENSYPIIGPDGYVEISYGLVIPIEYRDIFVFAEEITSETLLPEIAPEGYTYLVKASEHDIGTMYIYFNDEWQPFAPKYSWEISNEVINYNSQFVTQLSNPDWFYDANGNIKFREFEWIRGLRIVAKTMNKNNCTFDLIEFSPRLTADISKSIQSFSVNKPMSDLGNGSIPIGNLSVSTGSIDIFDVDFSFNENNIFDFDTNTGSIIAKYMNLPAKFLFYDITRNVGAYDYFIPVKTMYSVEGFPQVQTAASVLNIALRDFFFYLETQPAPELLMTDVSLSYAVMLLLDYIGFDNIVFKRIDNGKEIIIPYFFSAPNQNCAEILQQLAVASQSAMFFDEYNNFVVMSKEYLLPSEENAELTRATDSYIYGQQTAVDEDGNSYKFLGYVYNLSELPADEQPGVYVYINNNAIYSWINSSWQSVGTVSQINQPNIINLSAQTKEIYNSGKISYTTRYIQRSINSSDMTYKVDRYQRYAYKPVLLWQVQGKQNLVSQNELEAQNKGYTLSAVPLNTSLNNEIPYVKNNVIYNNIIDLGGGIWRLGSYTGYLYANSEIIKYDAIQYAITATDTTESIVWINSAQLYQYYFAKLPFNGKMYRTGNVRIYTKPEYETVDGVVRMKDTGPNYPMKEHGRGQFGTSIVYHPVGLSSYWTNNDNIYGCIQQASDYLFNINEYINYPDNLYQYGIAGKVQQNFPEPGNYFNADVIAESSSRTGIVKNFLVDTLRTELDENYSKTTDPGSVQSSALLFNGPTLQSGVNPANFISYIVKNLNNTDEYVPPPQDQPRQPNIEDIAETISEYNYVLGLIAIYEDGVDPIVGGLPRGANYVTSINKNRLSLGTSISDNMYKIIIDGSYIDINTANAICTEMEQETGVIGVEPDYRVISYASNQYLPILNQNGILPEVDQIRFNPPVQPKPRLSKFTHFGTRMRIVGKIENGTNKQQTPIGNYEMFEASVASDQEVKIYGGSGGVAFNVNPDRNTGYFFEIVAMTVNNVNEYISNNTPTVSSYTLLSTPAVTCTNNVVTAYTEKQIEYKVGQSVIISGLVDTNNPTNTRTPLNGEYVITAINQDKKSFQYQVSANPTLTTTSKTGGTVQLVIPTDTNFANIYFYKNISDDKGSLIESYQRTSNVLTINTLNNNRFQVNDYIDILLANDPNSINGSYTVTEASGKMLKVASTGSNFAKVTITFTDAEKELKQWDIYLNNPEAVPVKLWSGLSQIIVDSGDFKTSGKAYADNQITTSYDLAVEYSNITNTTDSNDSVIDPRSAEQIGEILPIIIKKGDMNDPNNFATRNIDKKQKIAKRFYLYINNKQIATVDDPDSLEEINNMAIFVRGSSLVAFENVYALGNNYSSDTRFSLEQRGISQVFGIDDLDATDALRKYALSGILQKTYLANINSYRDPSYSLYFEEFGTILRECAYFNIKYDRAFPALYATLSKTVNPTKGYTVSGFYAGSYGAEFLVFNATDFGLNIDDTSGNFLQIQGIAFTQDTTRSFTVDDYLKRKANLVDLQAGQNNNIVTDPNVIVQQYNSIKNSRDKYGIREFSIESPYIQTDDVADEIFGWTIDKVSKPRKMVGINSFATTNLQLGDIVKINYTSNEGIEIVGDSNKRYVIYNMDYNKSTDGLSTTIHLIEV